MNRSVVFGCLAALFGVCLLGIPKDMLGQGAPPPAPRHHSSHQRGPAGLSAIVARGGQPGDARDAPVPGAVRSGGDCGTSIVMTLGQTLQLTLGAPAYDLGGTRVTDSAIIQQSVAAATWAPYPFQGDVPISVTPDGLVTATPRGYARLGASLSGNLVATCSIQVQ